MHDVFIRIQNYVNIKALNSLVVSVSFILEAGGRSRAESPNQIHRSSLSY